MQNYAGFVSGLGKMALGLVIILLSASIFVVGTSVKTSIATRREEIEILELVGATPWRIRLPYVVEGVVTGLASSVLAVISTFLVFSFIRDAMSAQSIFLTVKTHLQFLNGFNIFLFILAGTAFGGFSAYFFVRKLNHGWLASQRSEA